jgi:hypothetical protein
VKASPEAQLRLLELADFDAELSRLDHRRRTLPEIEEAERIEGRDRELHDQIVALEAEEKDLGREQGKAEADVEQVRARVDRDRKRLDGGQVSSARELENLQSEIASLMRRQSDLEEIVLDVMERREGAQSSRDALAAERSALSGQLEDVGERAEVAAGEPADLMALYEKLREQHGVGAAALRGGRCQGCHLSLNTVDLNRIRAAAPDEVLRCEECRRILVRTPESGL